jgi:hypothetical protein
MPGDCPLPAIGQMSGCITTESGRLILGTRGGTAEEKNNLLNVKMICDE